MEAVLFDFATTLQKKAFDNLNQAGSVDTGSLASSIRHELTFENGSYTLQVFLSDYYDYVNKGVRGVLSGDKAPGSPYKFKTLKVSRKMSGALQGWAQRHNLKARIQNKTFPHKKTATFSKLAAGYSLAADIKRLD